jgi:hypothetical protein
MIKTFLPNNLSMQVVDENNQVVYESSKKWLHPLLDLEKENLDFTNLILVDRIAGKAAAALAIRMGFKKVKIELISELAKKMYEKHNVEVTYLKSVDKIGCMTESALEEESSIDEIYTFIINRLALN